MLDGASSDDATLVPSDDEDATPHLDPGRGQRVKGARYRTHKWGDVRKWDGVQFVHDGPARQSRHDGVKWDRARRKWIGSVCDATERSRDGRNGKLLHTASFDDEDACFAALRALRAEVATRESSTLHELAQALDHTRGLPPRPAKAADAQPATAYYGAAGHKAKGAATKAFRPTRYVRTSDGARGYRFIACCQHGTGPRDACTQVAFASKQGGEATKCEKHGGGRTSSTGPKFCSLCTFQRIAPKRQLRTGGNGLCCTCEEHRNKQARANGSDAPPAKSQSWEDHCFEKLLPRITYADGTPFPPDQRDTRKGGGLGTGKGVKRRRECDTTTNRFPDSLWVLRGKDARARLVVIGEADECSHGDRDPACESGKIDDEFQSVQARLAKEGAAHGAVARHDARMVPIVFVKFNPNAYDGPRVVKLDDRIAAVAELVNAYLHSSPTELAELPTKAPIVHVLYYHSKEGANNLAHFAAVATDAGWAYTVH
jgi:hypothetical protein